MNRATLHDKRAFSWTHDLAGAAEYAERSVWVNLPVAFEKQGARNWTHVEAVFAVGWALLDVYVQYAVEDFAYMYCAFRAFDFA